MAIVLSSPRATMYVRIGIIHPLCRSHPLATRPAVCAAGALLMVLASVVIARATVVVRLPNVWPTHSTFDSIPLPLSSRRLGGVASRRSVPSGSAEQVRRWGAAVPAACSPTVELLAYSELVPACRQHSFFLLGEFETRGNFGLQIGRDLTTWSRLPVAAPRPLSRRRWTQRRPSWSSCSRPCAPTERVEHPQPQQLEVLMLPTVHRAGAGTAASSTSSQQPAHRCGGSSREHHPSSSSGGGGAAAGAGSSAALQMVHLSPTGPAAQSMLLPLSPISTTSTTSHQQAAVSL